MFIFPQLVKFTPPHVWDDVSMKGSIFLCMHARPLRLDGFEDRICAPKAALTLIAEDLLLGLFLTRLHRDLL